MSATIPVMKGQMGSIEYYLTTMKAAEAVVKVKSASQLPEWNDLSIEERMQRKIDWGRVNNEIGKFIAQDPDRFYNAILVGIYNDTGMEYEPLGSIKGLPKAYLNSASNFGFLHVTGAEIWFALDGQHRLKGTAAAMSGVNEKGDAIDAFEKNLEVAKDDLPLLLIPFDPAMRARKIFNKVNKYAKQTGKGDNIITSEDDAFAIIVRRLMGSAQETAVIPEKLVNWTSNTLTARTQKFTTISVLYDGAKLLVERVGGKKVDTSFRPADSVLDSYFAQVKEMWGALLKLPIYKQALANPQELSALREKYLFMKPAGQSALIEAVATARKAGMSYDLITKRLQKLPWEANAPIWQGALMLSDRVQAGRTAVALGGRLIAYMIGVAYADQEKDILLRDLIRARGEDPAKPKTLKTLPPPVKP